MGAGGGRQRGGPLGPRACSSSVIPEPRHCGSPHPQPTCPGGPQTHRRTSAPLARTAPLSPRPRPPAPAKPVNQPAPHIPRKASSSAWAPRPATCFSVCNGLREGGGALEGASAGRRGNAGSWDPAVEVDGAAGAGALGPPPPPRVHGSAEVWGPRPLRSGVWKKRQVYPTPTPSKSPQSVQAAARCSQLGLRPGVLD